MQSTFLTNSPEETKALGKALGSKLKAGDVIALSGELGSGKTCFVQGLAEGLGVSPKSYVRSPSFIIMNSYKGRLPLYHADLYRLHSGEEINEIGLEEYLYGDGVGVIEWAEKAPSLLKRVSLEVKFLYEDENKRKLEMIGEGKRWKMIFKELQCPL